MTLIQLPEASLSSVCTLATEQQLHPLLQRMSIFLRIVPPVAVCATLSILVLLLLVLLYVFYKRRATQRLLEQAGLPTVFWTPRFINYNEYQQQPQQSDNHINNGDGDSDNDNDDKLKSTSITRMLPRMQRLQGPLGMYGTVYGFNTAVVHVAHPVAAKAILTHSETGASKRPAYNHFSNFCGRGVFTADGDDWKAKRAAVLHALLRGESEASSSLEERVLQQAHLAANELLDCIDDQQGKPFNVVPLIQKATIGLIFRYITHQDIPKEATSPLSATKKRHDCFQKASSPSSSLLQQYLQSVTNIRMIILAQSRSIWFLLPRWCYSTFASLYQQEEVTMVPIRQFAQLACQMAKPGSPLKQLQHSKSHQNGKRVKAGDGNGNNTIAFTSSTEITKNTKRNNNSGNDADSDSQEDTISQDLLEEAITLLFAGQDTSAATLSWTLHLLSLHPAAQEKLTMEVRSVLGPFKRPKGDTVQITKAMIGQMPYLDAVIKESMRLYPVAPFVVRKLSQEIVIPVATNNADGANSTGKGSNRNTSKKVIRLPQNAMACLWIYGLHHHPDFWAQPEDFIPERWLPSTAATAATTTAAVAAAAAASTTYDKHTNADTKDPGISNGAYMPFAIGPRNCLGQPLAQWILRSLLARLMQRYTFQDARELTRSLEGFDDNRSQWRQDMQAGFTVLPRGGVHIVASEQGTVSNQ